MSTIPLIYFEQFTKNKEFQTFSINNSQQVIKVNDKELDMEFLKTIAKEEDLETLFETVNFFSPERRTIDGTTEKLDIIISTLPKEVQVKADYNDGENGYNPIVIKDLQEAITKTWNNLFDGCLTVSSGNDYDILRAVNKLYRLRRSECSESKNFHDFTMNILKATELTPLESAYKEFIRRAFEGTSYNDDTLIVFEGIIASKDKCYLQIMDYVKFTENEQCNSAAYQPHIRKFGKYQIPKFRYDQLTIANIDNNNTMTKFKEIIETFN